MDSQDTIKPRLGLILALACSLFVVSTLPAQAADARPRPDYGSKAAFKIECELLGGLFIEDDIGNTWCYFDDGSKIVCDANGNDCWYILPGLTSPPSFPSIVIPPTDFTDTAGSGSLSAGDAGSLQTASLSSSEQKSETRLADDDSGKETKKKRKKAKKAKRHHKKATRKHQNRGGRGRN